MKNWYQSKTIWLAIIQAVIGILTLIAGVLNGSTQLNAAGITLIFKSLVDIYVRFTTDTSVRTPLS